jgi:uncharacterized protein YceK
MSGTLNINMVTIMMTAHKARWGALAPVLLFALARLTGMVEAPPWDTVQTALLELGGLAVTYAVSYLGIWLSPANKSKSGAEQAIQMQQRVGGSTMSVMLLALMLTGLTLSACGSVAVPETPRQALAAAEASYTALLETATSARRAGLLTADQVALVDEVVPIVSGALDAARQLLAIGETAMALIRVDEAMAQVQRAQRALPAARPASTAPPLDRAPMRGRVMGVAHA